MEQTKPRLAAGCDDVPADAVVFLADVDEIEQQRLPLPARGLLYLIIFIVITFLTWAGLAKLDNVVVARGKIVTTDPNIEVQPLEVSIIRTIDVRVGQVVHKGQVLAHLDPTFTTADTSRLEDRTLSLTGQVARLGAELRGDKTFTLPGADTVEQVQARIFLERQASYANRVKQQEGEIARIRASLIRLHQDETILKDRFAAGSEVENMRAQLYNSQNGSKLNLLASRDQRLSIESDFKNAVNQQSEARSALAAAEAALQAYRTEWRQKAAEELMDAQRDLQAVTEDLAKAKRRTELVTLTAPADAVVLDVAKRSVGSVVREAEPVVVLVPIGSALEAEVQVSAEDIGFISPGLTARMRLDAFPFQRHGLVDGDVLTLSEDAYVRDRPPVNGAPGSEAYYLGRLSLTRNNLRHLPPGARLLPGMTLTAEIVIGRRTILSYLLYPLMGVSAEAMRER
ncbi:MAG TPA: HlyD family type I secretion periplasmic adaptor subunit [Patescibacteria group bacterium]|nr:HlyD family type I secretion periplasmic adaptor subunit [Patescibacteria group bacterium]